jgi:hypothetical protein
MGDQDVLIGAVPRGIVLDDQAPGSGVSWRVAEACRTAVCQAIVRFRRKQVESLL